MDRLSCRYPRTDGLPWKGAKGRDSAPSVSRAVACGAAARCLSRGAVTVTGKEH